MPKGIKLYNQFPYNLPCLKGGGLPTGKTEGYSKFYAAIKFYTVGNGFIRSVIGKKVRDKHGPFLFYNLFVPGFFATFGAAQISGSAHMHCHKYTFIFWNILMSTAFALIIAGLLLNTQHKGCCN